MGIGLGIAALVFSIIAIFVPVLGIMIGWFALALATLAALAGNKTFSIAVIAISVVNYFFLTPLLWVGAVAGDSTPLHVSLVMLAAPIAGLILRVVFSSSSK